MSATITILVLGTLLAVAGIALVVNHRRWRRDFEDREAELEERIRDLQERQTAQVERLKRERRRIEETGHLDFAEDLLDVLDDFDNALREFDELDDNHREGLEMTRRKLIRTLEAHDIERIEPESAESFDPEVHEALRAVDPEEADPDTVVQCHRPGYRYGDRILRPAAVDVAVGRSSTDESDDEPAESEPTDTDQRDAVEESPAPDQEEQAVESRASSDQSS